MIPYLSLFNNMNFSSKKNIVFLILSGFFITNAVVAELIGGKLIQIGPFALSIGIIPWPVVFLATDLINEFYGKKAVKKLTILTSSLIGYAFLILLVAMFTRAASFSPVQDAQFDAVFGQSMWIIVGSITAFVVSQLVDVFVFWFLREKTGGRMIWLRSTGSTAISQLIDTFIVGGIAFWLPGKIAFQEYINMSGTGYVAKLIIAILLTPLIYFGHFLIDKYFGEKHSHDLIEAVAEKNTEHTK